MMEPGTSSSKRKQKTSSSPVQSSGSEKESTPTATTSTASPSENSHFSSDEHKEPSRWTVDLIDRFGIRKEKTDPDRILQKWRLCFLSESELSAIDAIVDETICLALADFDFNCLEDLPYNVPYKTWGIKFKPTPIGMLKTFNENIEKFRFHLYEVVHRMHVPKKGENQEPYEIGYQIIFEKLLECVDFRIQSQLTVRKEQLTVFGQEVTSKADIVGLKSDDPCKILFICEVKKECHAEETTYSPVKKKLRSSTDPEFAADVTSSSSESRDMPSNVFAQHIGELLSYMERSVLVEGLLGMVIQKTNVMFTYLRIYPETMAKINGWTKPGPVKLETTNEENPVFFYTQQFNLLKKGDRRSIFKTLLTIKMMESRASGSVSEISSARM